MSIATDSTQLTDFFARLGEDPAALAEYERDPRAFVERSGLPEAALAALSSGDLDRISAAVAAERAEYDEHAPPEHTPGEHASRAPPGEHAPPEHEHAPPEHTPGEHAPPETRPPSKARRSTLPTTRRRSSTPPTTRRRSSTPLTTEAPRLADTDRDPAPIGGSLTVVGTGIDSTSQLSTGARGAIAGADLVLHMLADPVTVRRVQMLNANERSLTGHYAPAKDRRLTYSEIVDEVVAEVLSGANVCMVLYGHPGFYALPGREAIRRVRAAGLSARMAPAVSSLDCLFADLELDPAVGGLQVYGATYFWRRRPPVDPRATLVLLQVGMLGEEGAAPTAAVQERFASLVQMLRDLYGPDREALLYEASPYPGIRPRIVRFQLDQHSVPAPPRVALLCITA